MALSTAPRPARVLAIAGSAALAYLRMTAYTVAALYALAGGVQLAGRTGSPFLVALALTVLGVAGAELVIPGLITRDTIPHRTVQLAAAVPIVAVLVALAAVILSSPGATGPALDSLRALVLMTSVLMVLWLVRALVARDGDVVPAFRSGR